MGTAAETTTTEITQQPVTEEPTPAQENGAVLPFIVTGVFLLFVAGLFAWSKYHHPHLH